MMEEMMSNSRSEGFVPVWAIIWVESICDRVSQSRLGGQEAEAPQGIDTN